MGTRYNYFVGLCFGLLSFMGARAQGGMVMNVQTNVNSFHCVCYEKDFKYEFPELGEGAKELAFPVNLFDCPKKMMEADLKKLFEAKDYPLIHLQIKKIEGKLPSLNLKIALTIRTVKREYNLPLRLEEGYLTGEQVVSMTDFGLEPPTKAMGLVRVKDDVTITLTLPAKRLLAQYHASNGSGEQGSQGTAQNGL